MTNLILFYGGVCCGVSGTMLLACLMLAARRNPAKPDGVPRPDRYGDLRPADPMPSEHTGS